MSKQDWGDFDEDDNENLLVARESNGEIKKIYPYPFDDSIMQTPLTLKSEKNCFVENLDFVRVIYNWLPASGDSA